MTDRDPRISGVLDELTPRSDRASAWDDVVVRAAPRRRVQVVRRRVGIVGAAASLAGLVGLIGILIVATPDEKRSDPAAPATGGLSILSRPATPGDRLPAWVERQRDLSLAGVDLRTARRALVDGDRGLWVVRARTRKPRGTFEDRVCMVDASLVAPGRRVGGPGRGAGGSGGLSCVPEAGLAGTALIEPMSKAASGAPQRGDIAGVAPDGFETAEIDGRTQPITNNGFIMRDVPLTAPVRLTGPGGTEAVVAPSKLLPLPALPVRTVPPGRATLSVFDRPARTEDRLPEQLIRLFDIRLARDRQGGFLPTGRAVRRPRVGDARFAAEVAGRRYWLVPDKDPQFISVAVLDRRGGRSLSDLSRPSERAIVWTMSGGPQAPLGRLGFTLRAIVPDGFDQLRASDRIVAVTNNFVVIHGVRPGDLAVEATGSNGRYTELLPGGQDLSYSLRVVLPRAPPGS